MNNQLISYNNTRILLSHERKQKVVLDIYPLRHLLTYVREGMLKVKSGKETHCFRAGEFVLFKKFTQANITKTWCSNSSKFSSFVFTFHEELVREALMQLDLPPATPDKKPPKRILAIGQNPVLSNFIQSLQLFFGQGIEMDAPMARLKTLEAILGIARSDHNIALQLQDFSVKSKAPLHEYMKFHFLENKPLSEFSRESGRSLSAFKRDFQELYGTPPRRWLRQKRLDHAFHLLKTTGKKPSEIYLECGFEDLAHFSKSFKQQFGLNPSELNPEPYRQVS